MNRQQFIDALKTGLTTLPRDERNSAITYYQEFFEDAGVENEQAVIASLGSPIALAETIIKESGFKENDKTIFTPPAKPQTMQQKNNPDPSRTALAIVLIIVTFPFWIGFVVSAFAILFSFIVTVFALLFAFTISGFVLVGVGFVKLFTFPPAGFLLVGAGLIIISLTWILIFPLVKFSFKLFASVFRGVISIIRSILGRNEVETI